MGKQRPWLAGLMAVVGAVALYRMRLRPWMYTWGADDDEVTAVLPGDELVSSHTMPTTRALTIDAPIAAVWAWLAQVGEDRGGFYSYSLLERGCGRAHPKRKHRPPRVAGRASETPSGSPATTATLQSKWWPRWRQERTWC
jgi:hypothetical protein